MKEFDVLKIFDIQTNDTIYLRKAEINYVIALSEKNQAKKFPEYNSQICFIKLYNRIAFCNEERDFIYCFYNSISKFWEN